MILPHSALLCLRAETYRSAPSQCKAVWGGFGRFLCPLGLWPSMVMGGPVGNIHSVTVALVSDISSHQALSALSLNAQVIGIF